MNYQESGKILEEIKKSKKILINCHRGPDSDSVGSAVAMGNVLKSFGKDAEIVCSSPILEELKFIKGSEKIKRVSYSSFDFSEFDLFIVLDSSTWGMVTGNKEDGMPDINMVVIDHHVSNASFGNVNLVDPKTTSTAEMLYKIFEDWKVKIDKETAEALLTGIIGDTGAFQYQGVGKETLDIAGALMEAGADKDRIIQNVYRNIDFLEVKLWGEIIGRMEFDRERRFVWSAIPNSVFKEYGELAYAKEDAANLFFSVVRDSDFGVIMVEIKEKILSVSLRSKNDFDVSKIAEEIGGGGHKAASGVRIEGLNFDEAVEKVLEACRKYAGKNL